jgi:hypothetical protein
MQWRHPMPVGHLRPRAGLQQEIRDRVIIALDGPVQRCRPVSRGDIHVRVFRDESAQGCGVTTLDSFSQRRFAAGGVEAQRYEECCQTSTVASPATRRQLHDSLRVSLSFKYSNETHENQHADRSRRQWRGQPARTVAEAFCVNVHVIQQGQQEVRDRRMSREHEMTSALHGTRTADHRQWQVRVRVGVRIAQARPVQKH